MIYVDAEQMERRQAGTIKIHGPDAFAGMRKAGRLAAEALDQLVPLVKPGVTTQATSSPAANDAPVRVDPVAAMASGWMRVRQRAKQGGVELPLVISDHADWAELNATLDEVAAPEVWVTHGAEEALIHAAGLRGMRGRALRLVGYGEEEA